jgi:ATP adenylyltransferase/5',5'''-P-1,P-4-tetraphosphate phosphorylase II
MHIWYILDFPSSTHVVLFDKFRTFSHYLFSVTFDYYFFYFVLSLVDFFIFHEVLQGIPLSKILCP